MLRIIAISLFLLASIHSNAQLQWVHNMDMAKMNAINQNKLILVDFWAIWCGPCRTMDTELWNTEQMKKLSDRFIPLKVDVDVHTQLAIKYQIRGIPRVMIMNINGDVLWDITGFRSADPFFDVISNIPENLGDINKSLYAEIQHESDINDYYAIANSYQDVARLMEEGKIRGAFLMESNKYYKKTIKADGDDLIKGKAQLYSILNSVYLNKAKKAKSQLDKLKLKTEAEELTELTHFVRANYCLIAGDEDGYNRCLENIKDETLIARLEKH